MAVLPVGDRAALRRDFASELSGSRTPCNTSKTDLQAAVDAVLLLTRGVRDERVGGFVGRLVGEFVGQHSGEYRSRHWACNHARPW